MVKHSKGTKADTQHDTHIKGVHALLKLFTVQLDET